MTPLVLSRTRDLRLGLMFWSGLKFGLGITNLRKLITEEDVSVSVSGRTMYQILTSKILQRSMDQDFSLYVVWACYDIKTLSRRNRDGINRTMTPRELRIDDNQSDEQTFSPLELEYGGIDMMASQRWVPDVIPEAIERSKPLWKAYIKEGMKRYEEDRI